MARREDLRTAVDALGGSVVVCGAGEAVDALDRVSVPGVRLASLPDLVGDVTAERSDPAASAGVVAAVVVVDPVASARVRSDLRALVAANVFTVAVVSGTETDPDALARIATDVDGVVLAGDDDGDALGPADAADALLATVQQPGFVNLDLTDARTVLSSGTAAIATGTASRDAPAAAIASAFERLPDGVDAGGAGAVLVDVVVDPETSITAATDAIGEVRDRVAADANVIWGGSVDDDADDALGVRLVVADVRYDPPLAAGDPCPRCQSSLSAYRLGASETLSCEACGYSGIGIRRESVNHE